MIEEISDTKLQSHLKRVIARSPSDMALLKSTLYCGSKTVHQIGKLPTVAVLANNKTAKFFGFTTCKNSWFCPICSARQMAKHATEIAIAIDALKQPKYNQLAFMITFTIPHTRGMSCEESTEILYQSWKDLIVRGNHNLKRPNQGKDVFATFCEEFNCKHRVRVGEYTWGQAGWHPHFHCLFWVNANKIQQVKDWQEKFQERWLKIVKRNTLKYWNKKNPKNIEQNKLRIEFMYSNLNNEPQAAYISVDEKGNVIVQKSSMYICGWGADRELTGNYQNKATKDGHLTPHQILERSAAGDEKMTELYLEFARATRKKRHARINFSTRSGIKNIIEQHRKTKAYAETMKKKAIAEVKANGIWHMVFWFNKQQWSQICFLDRFTDVKHKILCLSKEIDGRKQIIDFLLSIGIDTSMNKDHPNQKDFDELGFKVA